MIPNPPLSEPVTSGTAGDVCAVKPGFFATVWKHLRSWPELYVCLPLVILSLPGASLLIYFLMGRAPQESMDWILDLAGRINVAALIILFASFARQATGVWLTKEEMLKHPLMAIQSSLTKGFYFVFFYWLFTK